MPQAAQTSTAPANAPSGANGAAYLTDEQILGIESSEESLHSSHESQVTSHEQRDSSSAAGQPPRNDNGEADVQALAEIFPGGVETARAAAQSADQLAKLDAAYFSSDAGKQAELAAYLYSAEPRAFAAMVEHAARVLAERDPAAFAALYQTIQGGAAARAFAQGDVAAPFRAPGVPAANDRQNAAGLKPAATQPAQDPAQQIARERADIAHAKTEIDRERQQLRVDKFEAFQRNANDAVVAQVRKSLDATLEKTLPINVSGAARERIGQSIFTEVHGALANDRGLAQQVASVIAQERYDDAAREQVSALVLARARAVMPEIARRIVGEWTSGVVASHRQRAEKQDAASRRVELTGAGGAESVPQRVPSPAELRRMSDQEILDY
jgi:hypothetical protein